jgi:hypothetical protein
LLITWGREGVEGLKPPLGRDDPKPEGEGRLTLGVGRLICGREAGREAPKLGVLGRVCGRAWGWGRDCGRA